MPIQTAGLEIFADEMGGFKIHVKTPDGATIISVGPTNVDGTLYGFIYGKTYTGIYAPNPETKLKKVTAKKNRRSSIRQEEEIVEALGGQRQAGSGSVAHLKGDVRVRDKYRVEAKYTRSGSYRVERKELSKIRGECKPPEQPLFVIDFVDPQTGGAPDRWVLVPFEHFRQMEYAPSHAAHHPRGPRQT